MRGNSIVVRLGLALSLAAALLSPSEELWRRFAVKARAGMIN